MSQSQSQTYMPLCRDGKGEIHTGTIAEGYILDPDGIRRGAMCRACAQTVIDEYKSKLGETWTFDSVLPVTIKGPMSDCWDQVQAVQDRPFVAIWCIGPPSIGDNQVNIESLLDVIAQHSLDIEHFEGKFWTDNPCKGIVTRNPNGRTVYLNGDPMYRVEGVVRFFGNFLVRSHVFCLDTNHLDTIARLKQAIRANIEFQREHGTGTLSGDLEIEAQERAMVERRSTDVLVKEGKTSSTLKPDASNSTPNLDLFD